MDERTAHLFLEFVNLSRAEMDPEHTAEVEDELRRQLGGNSLLDDARAVDQQLGQQMRDVPVPPDLRGRILDRLAERRGRVIRRRIARSLALAATLLVAVTLGLGLLSLSRPVVDAERIAAHYEPQVQDPFGAAQAWLGEQGLAFHPDAPFDPHLLAGFDHAEFQGKTVPVMHFVNHREGAFARVYIVRSGQFDFNVPTERAHGSFAFVTVLKDTDQAHDVAYVVVSNTRSLQPFLLGGAGRLA